MLPNEKVWARWSTMTSRAPSGWHSAVSTLTETSTKLCGRHRLTSEGGEVSLSRVTGLTNRAPLVRFLNEKGSSLDVSFRKFWVSRCSQKP